MSDYGFSPDAVLKVSEAAATRLWGCAPTIRAAIRTGDLPAARNERGHFLLRVSDLDAWRAARDGADRTGVQHHDPLDGLDGLDADARAWVEAVVAEAPPLTGNSRQRVLGALRAGLARTEAAESARAA